MKTIISVQNCYLNDEHLEKVFPLINEILSSGRITLGYSIQYNFLSQKIFTNTYFLLLLTHPKVERIIITKNNCINIDAAEGLSKIEKNSLNKLIFLWKEMLPLKVTSWYVLVGHDDEKIAMVRKNHDDYHTNYTWLFNRDIPIPQYIMFETIEYDAYAESKH